MSIENELEEKIKEYCQTELEKAKKEWIEKNTKEFREILQKVRDTGNYEDLRQVIKLLHSGKSVLRYQKDKLDLESLWKNVLKEIVETEPEVLLHNIDERFERWMKVKGAGKGLISEALAFYYPKHFAPWNNTVEWYFKEFGWGKPKKYSKVLVNLGRLKEMFEKVCGDKVNFIVVDHFGWWLKKELEFKDKLREILKRQQGKYHEKWSQIKEEVTSQVELIRKITSGDSAISLEDIDTIGNITSKIHQLTEKEILWLWGSVKATASDVKDFLNRDDFRRLLRKSEMIKSVEDLDSIQGDLIEVVNMPHTKLSTTSSWMCIFNPRIFLPVNVRVLNNALREELGLQRFWGGGTDAIVYFDFLRALHEVKQEVGVEDMLEVAYYLSKYEEEQEKDSNNISKVSLNTYFASRGYHFPDHLIAQFYTALKTKGFVILSGLSGTGKTKMAIEFAKLLSNGNKNHVFFSVRPDWRDSKPLIGYYNPLDSKYYKTPLLEFIMNAIKNYVFSKTYLNSHKVWSIRCGEEGEPNKYANIALRDGYISIGWYEIPDMRKISPQGLEEITKMKDNEGNRIDPLGQTLKFFKEISVGDIVIMPVKANGNNVAIGIVLSDYYYVPNPADGNPQRHRRNVIWLGTFELSFIGIPVTVQEIRENTTFLNKKALQPIFSLDAMPYFIILDEMNLAHVEYYFADFLSVLESGRDESGFTRESIKLHNDDAVETFQSIPKELKLPPNLYIIGTVNMDETTYSFSPKVLDRAFTIEFHDVNLKKYPPEKTELTWEEIKKLRNDILNDLRRGGRFLAVYKKGKNNQEKSDIEEALEELKNADNGKYWQILQQLNKALEPYDLHFGYRVVDEIALFFKNAKESWRAGIVAFENNNDENNINNEIFDLVLLMKILPKFHGNRKKLEKPLLMFLKMAKEGKLDENKAKKKSDELWKEIFGEETLSGRAETIVKELENTKNYTYKYTAKKVLRMLRQLYEIGFASFS